MITVRSSNERGAASFGWLDTRHSFSFGNYYDPNHMSFGTLRVINEDKVQPGKGFATHGHRDMEIITYILEGALQHQDSIGNGSVIRPGDVQRMTAGTGILHSEFNASQTEPVHLLQIWILPENQGLTPSYEERHFARAERQGKLRLIGSRDGRDRSVKIHQDVNLYTTLLGLDESVQHQVAQGRSVWIQVAKGAVQVNQEELFAGDGAAITAPDTLEIRSASNDTELLIFDLGNPS